MQQASRDKPPNEESPGRASRKRPVVTQASRRMNTASAHRLASSVAAKAVSVRTSTPNPARTGETAARPPAMSPHRGETSVRPRRIISQTASVATSDQHDPGGKEAVAEEPDRDRQESREAGHPQHRPRRVIDGVRLPPDDLMRELPVTAGVPLDQELPPGRRSR